MKCEAAAAAMRARHRAEDARPVEPAVAATDTARRERLEHDARELRAWLAARPEDRRGPTGGVRQSNRTDPESAKMATGKGVIQGYTGVAAVDRACQIIVEAQAHGTGPEQEVRVPVVTALAPVLTADAGHHGEADLRRLAGHHIDARVADHFRGAKGDCGPCPLRSQGRRTPDRTPTRQVACVRGTAAGAPERHTDRTKRRRAPPAARAQSGRRFATVEPVVGDRRADTRLDRFTLCGHAARAGEGRWAVEAVPPRARRRATRPPRVRRPNRPLTERRDGRPADHRAHGRRERRRVRDTSRHDRPVLTRRGRPELAFPTSSAPEFTRSAARSEPRPAAERRAASSRATHR